MRSTVVGQTGNGCWSSVIRVFFTVIYHRKICYKIFTTSNIIKLCHIFTWLLQIIVIGNKNRVGAAAICTLIILNGRLLEFCQAIGPIIGICQYSLRSYRNCFNIIFCLVSADRHSCRSGLVSTGARAVAGNRNCGFTFLCIHPAVGMRADSKIKCMCCM